MCEIVVFQGALSVSGLPRVADARDIGARDTGARDTGDLRHRSIARRYAARSRRSRRCSAIK